MVPQAFPLAMPTFCLPIFHILFCSLAYIVNYSKLLNYVNWLLNPPIIDRSFAVVSEYDD